MNYDTYYKSSIREICMIIKQSRQKYIISSYYNSIFIGSLFSKETDPGQLLNKLLESIRPKDKVNKINDDMDLLALSLKHGWKIPELG